MSTLSSKLVSRWNVKKTWIKFLSSKNFNYVATIQKPMKHPYKLQKNLERLAGCEQIENMFYSVERNADCMGYHIHLMLKAHRTKKYNIRYVLNLQDSDQLQMVKFPILEY